MSQQEKEQLVLEIDSLMRGNRYLDVDASTIRHLLKMLKRCRGYLEGGLEAIYDPLRAEPIAYRTALTPEEVASFTGLSKYEVNKEIRTKNLPSMKIGRKVLVLKTDFVHWLRQTKDPRGPYLREKYSTRYADLGDDA